MTRKELKKQIIEIFDKNLFHLTLLPKTKKTIAREIASLIEQKPIEDRSAQIQINDGMDDDDQDLAGDYDIHVPFKTKEGRRYRLYEIPPIRLCLTERQKELLNKVYGILWMDAYYDPESEEIKKYAKPLADMMHELNKDLHFKL
jgi:hypothetical protein